MNHAVQIVTEHGPSSSGIQTAIDNALSGMNRELPEQATDAAVATAGLDGGTEHVRAIHRVSDAETKADVLDNLDNQLGNTNASWYEVRYHECTHDENPPSPCPDWTTERSSGAVPSDV